MSSTAFPIPIPRIPKSLLSDLAYGFEWNPAGDKGPPWLAPGDVLSASTWTYSPNDGTLTLNDLGIVGSQTAVRITGGKLNTIYRITNFVTGTLTPLAKDQRSIDIYVVQR